MNSYFASLYRVLSVLACIILPFGCNATSVRVKRQKHILFLLKQCRKLAFDESNPAPERDKHKYVGFLKSYRHAEALNASISDDVSLRICATGAHYMLVLYRYRVFEKMQVDQRQVSKQAKQITDMVHAYDKLARYASSGPIGGHKWTICLMSRIASGKKLLAMRILESPVPNALQKMSSSPGRRVSQNTFDIQFVRPGMAPKFVPNDYDMPFIILT